MISFAFWALFVAMVSELEAFSPTSNVSRRAAGEGSSCPSFVPDNDRCVAIEASITSEVDTGNGRRPWSFDGTVNVSVGDATYTDWTIMVSFDQRVQDFDSSFDSFRDRDNENEPIQQRWMMGPKRQGQPLTGDFDFTIEGKTEFSSTGVEAWWCPGVSGVKFTVTNECGDTADQEDSAVEEDTQLDQFEARTSNFEQCGADNPNYKEECGSNYSPPICGPTSACVTDDGCKYNCITKKQCQETLFNSLLENGKLLCNCAKEPTFRYSWACEFNDNQHGYAAVPEINKVYQFDQRNITLLEGSRISEYESLRNTEANFDNFFQTSPCHGVKNVLDESVTFSDLFNNKKCLPSCETIQSNGTLNEQCRVVIGYDDLVVPLGEESLKPAVLQRGHSWMLTCTRSLNGEAVGNGTVTEAPRAPVTDEITIETKFNLDIHCCDPEDTDCFDDCLNTPVFQIGPYADLNEKRFFVSMDVEYGNKAVQERGFLHVKSCTFEEVGRDNQVLSGPLELLHDGCPNTFGGVSFLENLRDRSLESSYRETMDLKPFRIDSDAISFNLNCQMLNCPWDAIDNNLCKLKDQCYLSDRYEPFYSYISSSMQARSGRRLISGSVQSETITKTMRHPCSQIHKEGDTYCCGDEASSCWTFELCENRPRSADPTVDPQENSSMTQLSIVAVTFSAFILFFML